MLQSCHVLRNPPSQLAVFKAQDSRQGLSLGHARLRPGAGSAGRRMQLSGMPLLLRRLLGSCAAPLRIAAQRFPPRTRWVRIRTFAKVFN